jgi:hypothetical protein
MEYLFFILNILAIDWCPHHDTPAHFSLQYFFSYTLFLLFSVTRPNEAPKILFSRFTLVSLPLRRCIPICDVAALLVLSNDSWLIQSLRYLTATITDFDLFLLCSSTICTDFPPVSTGWMEFLVSWLEQSDSFFFFSIHSARPGYQPSPPFIFSLWKCIYTCFYFLHLVLRCNDNELWEWLIDSYYLWVLSLWFPLE